MTGDTIADRQACLIAPYTVLGSGGLDQRCRQPLAVSCGLQVDYSAVTHRRARRCQACAMQIPMQLRAADPPDPHQHPYCPCCGHIEEGTPASRTSVCRSPP